MGNLELNASSTHSPYSRKPIFHREHTLQHQNQPRSLSPHLATTPKSNNYKSGFNYGHFLRYSKINQSRSKNLAYVHPNMISSVIKNSSHYQQRPLSVFAKNNKSNICFERPTLVSFNRTPKQTSTSMIRIQKYVEKPFQSSPNRGKVMISANKNKKKNISSEKENYDEDTFKQQSFNRNQFQEPFTLSTITYKSPLSLSKIVKSGETSGRGYDVDGHNFLSPHKCCCHHGPNYQELVKQQQLSIDNAPTERKKPVRTFQPFSISASNQKQRNKRLKIQINENSETETARAIRQSKMQSSNIHRQNREKCQQIIKRVRNFNEFLNQIKKKLKKQADISSSQNNTISNMSVNQQQSVNQLSANTSIDQHNNSIASEYNQKLKGHKKSITMALKLENQKIQLQKYRKMVQRQLSKQHSIQSIQIEGGRNKEKIITISFQKKILKQNQNSKIQGLNQSRESKKSEIKNQKEQSTRTQPDYEQNKSVIKRVNKISKLMDKLEGMQSKLENNNSKQIREFLKSQVSQKDDQ